MDKTRFAIKWNNAQAAGPCAVCGGVANPPVGPELFMADSWAPVCWDCGRKHAPEFADMLMGYWHSACAEGDKWP